jgi:hypothetical protein
MEWSGRTLRGKCDEEIGFDGLKEIEVVAKIKEANGIFSCEVRDVNENGSLSKDYNTDSEWVGSLGWAKRKCNELVPNPISKFTWEKVN